MKLTSAITLFCLVGTANGWAICSPKRIIKKSIIKKGLVGAAVVAGTAVTAGVVGVGAAVAYTQINGNREVYEPSPGSMSKFHYSLRCVILCAQYRTLTKFPSRSWSTSL